MVGIDDRAGHPDGPVLEEQGNRAEDVVIDGPWVAGERGCGVDDMFGGRAGGGNYQLRKVTKTRGSFPTDDAVLKIFYLATDNIGHHRGGELGTHTQGWKQALNAFAVAFPGRIPDTLI